MYVFFGIYFLYFTRNNTTISSDEIVSIRAVWNEEFQSFCVTAEAGFIVTQPDHLINAKCVVSADFCLRKTILSEKFTGIDDRFKVSCSIQFHFLKQRLRRRFSDNSFLYRRLTDSQPIGTRAI